MLLCCGGHGEQLTEAELPALHKPVRLQHDCRWYAPADSGYSPYCREVLPVFELLLDFATHDDLEVVTSRCICWQQEGLKTVYELDLMVSRDSL